MHVRVCISHIASYVFIGLELLGSCNQTHMGDQWLISSFNFSVIANQQSTCVSVKKSRFECESGDSTVVLIDLFWVWIKEMIRDCINQIF